MIYIRKHPKGFKICSKCKICKPRSEFHFSQKKKGWLKADCKVCRSEENYNPLSNRHTPPEVRRQHGLERRRKWYRLNFSKKPEKYRKYVIDRRARLKNAEGFYTETQWLDKLKYYGFKCIYCLRPITIDSATKDHKIPLIKGGANWIANIAPACQRCNSGKRDNYSFEYKPKYL